MTDLIVREAIPAAVMNQLPDVLKNALRFYDSIRTYEDVERYLLKGNGYSDNTLRSYLTSFKQFIEFVGAPSVFDTTRADIENWFDHLAKGDHKTAALRLAGVRSVYHSLEDLLPGSSPFNALPERLEKKLKGNSKKRLTALDREELNAILTWAAEKTTPEAMTDYGLMYFLATSGLRASEAASLTWKDIELIDGIYYAIGIGKGNKTFEQELYPGSLEAVRAAFKATTGRRPQADDSLFLTSLKKPMPYHTVWKRIKDLGAAIKKEGVIKKEEVIKERDIIFSPHLMRRTFATVLHGAGMAIKAVQVQTRHSNTATLEKYYLKNKESSTPYFDTVFGM